MKIIIDGYNLIRQSSIFSNFEAQSLEKGRNGLIKSLVNYKKVRGYHITVVFDGWQGGSINEAREVIGGINVIYSKFGERADEVIKRIAQIEGEGALVVTSDSDIVRFVEKRGGVAIPSQEFEKRIHLDVASDNLSFYKDDDFADRSNSKKKGPSHRLSKKERKILQKLRKL